MHADSRQLIVAEKLMEEIRKILLRKLNVNQVAI